MRRRLAFGVIPLALIYTLIALGEGLWILAIPGVIVLLAQLVVIFRRPRRRDAPVMEPAPDPEPAPVIPPPVRPPVVRRTPRRTTPQQRAAARRRGRRDHSEGDR